MSDGPALPLYLPPAAPPHWLNGEWRVALGGDGHGLAPGFHLPRYDDSRWDVVAMPHLRRGTKDYDTLWCRCRFNFQRPHGERALLRFGGAFYAAQVWLNGVRLGWHEGYFQPFGFDVTDLLNNGENVLAVRTQFPVEAGAFKRKTAIAGIFADWDCKPYPSAFFPNLPAPKEWTVPLGLWQPVSLHHCAPVLLESLIVAALPQHAHWRAGTAEAAEVSLTMHLRNLTDVPQTATAQVGLLPHNFSQQVTCAGEWQIALGPREVRLCRFALHLPAPRLWFPHTHGQPNLYAAHVSVNGTFYQQTFGVRSITADIDHDRWLWRLNDKQVFPKGSNYVSDFFLDRVHRDSLRRDIELAREANLDLLRVHAHIAPQAFYQQCDSLGMMVMCDFPLIWTYAYNLPPAEAEAFQQSVARQAGDMVRLLGSHPAIALWSMHNEPPWTPDGSFLGSDLHNARTNQDVDRAAARLVGELDPSRPVIAASGEHDQHLYHGWYTGGWRDNRALRPRFPTEFGVQAMPNLHSPFWATVNTSWPIDADDSSWAFAGYQSVFWASPGIGGPAQFNSLAHYVAESQAYQAFYIRYVIDQWRRQKFNPVGGYIHFLFTDGFPAITWSVLDYYRLPKAGHSALAESSTPVRVCFDLGDTFSVERGFHLVYAVGGELHIDLYLVNDDYRMSGEATVQWWIERRPAADNLLARAERVWRRAASRAVRVHLPAAECGAMLLSQLRIPLRRAGQYQFCCRVVQGGRVLSRNDLPFRVGAAQTPARSPRRVPALLVNKVYRLGSLRHTDDGFAFSLKNPAMPVSLVQLSELKVDGVDVDVSQVDFVFGGVARQASAISRHAPLELPAGEQLTVLVRRHRLAPGAHQLELTAQFIGLGEFSVRLRDNLI